MDVKQVYQFVNTATAEALGDSALVKEDLSNVVDVGAAVFDANAQDAFVRSLVNHIGRVICVDRAYKISTPSLLKEGWEFGSCLEKLQVELPDAEENESWELQDRTAYDPNLFYKSVVTAKFFNKKCTLEIPLSITEKQVKQSFSNATQLNAFISMLYQNVQNSLTVKLDALAMRLVNDAIAESFYAEVGSSSISSRSGNKTVNLLYLYNQRFGTSLSAANAITNKDFLTFATYTMSVYADRMTRMSKLFNIDAKARFTPADKRKCILLSEFAKAIGPYAKAPIYNQEYINLPDAETVPYWQGSGQGYGFADTAKVYCTTASGHDITATGVLGVMFDNDAMMICNEDNRTTTYYNPKGEFYNNWAKADVSEFLATDEQIIVFYVA